MMVTAEELIVEARRWIGTPYRHQGRTAAGLDCIGFIIWVLAQKDLLPTDFERQNYGRLPQRELLERTALYCTPIPEPIPGCLLLIRWPGQREPGHAALYAGETMIHSYAISKQVIEHGYRAPWPRLTVNRWLLPGVRYG
jgi:cell wall-associated NlpC family hydrolase